MTVTEKPTTSVESPPASYRAAVVHRFHAPLSVEQVQRRELQAGRSLRRAGRLVFVALPADNQVTVSIFETVLNGITIVGSIVGTRTDLREVFELHKTHVIREVRPLEAVNEAIADVEAGEVAARVVFEL